jgi:predicted ATP-grasp superfamily ATP-dependent carboligase
MQHVILNENPALRRPVLFVALGGWGDAGQAATRAIAHLIEHWSARLVGEVDPEPFFDYREQRPRVKLDASGERQISWPGHRLYARQGGEGGVDALLLVGPEPGLRWKAFCGDIVDLARDQKVSLVVMPGAFLGPVSHRDAPPLVGWAWPEELNRKLRVLGVSPTEYEGPTSLGSVLSAELARADIPVANLWAALPAYLSSTTNPTGALALLRCMDGALDLGLDLSPLQEASDRFVRQVDEAVTRIQASTSGPFVPGIPAGESRPGENSPPREDDIPAGPAELPTGEEAVRDIEEFLRQSRR